MTIGVIADPNSFVAELIALACESLGHDCLVIRDLPEAARILHVFRLDRIVLDIRTPGPADLDWLEAIARARPELTSCALVLTDSELPNDDVVRIRTLGATVAPRPNSMLDITSVVMARLETSPAGLE